ncbi:CPBP family intramembrane metalloprotease [Nonomuraea sp. K274]|uniref:CPBP family intramembrane metalloprotease n=1 Tax=Nonomuraea cypriaca TaxID=1187855 RepID=A0A931A936_9ACTN|nr:type II CAAX endopeptidase family protein [Nonomuraea cypriaca]MBF8188576.1 CPBP family intramembrane metalloprotease [Nonomuraea cypriaca]
MHENPGPYPSFGTPPPPGHPFPPVPQPRSWFVPVPSGARYDHLARIPGAKPWRAIVGTLLIAVGFVAVSAVVLVAGMVVATLLGISMPLEPTGALFGDPVLSLVVALLGIAPMLLLVFGTAALVQRRRPGSLSSVAGRLRWSWLLGCLGLSVLALVLGQVTQFLALSLTGEKYDMFGWVGWQAFLPPLIAIVLLVPFQAAAEEYVFRGWFVQALGVHVRNPIWAILIGSALFASLHGYGWAGLADVFAFGAVMAWLVVRTGGLEAGIALHVMNNMLAFGLSAATGQLEGALIQETVAVPWQSLLGSVVQLGVYAFSVLYLSRKRSISTISG